jgi:hypothetical protein
MWKDKIVNIFNVPFSLFFVRRTGKRLRENGAGYRWIGRPKERHEL